jgi:hypothetical protein
MRHIDPAQPWHVESQLNEKGWHYDRIIISASKYLYVTNGEGLDISVSLWDDNSLIMNMLEHDKTF